MGPGDVVAGRFVVERFAGAGGMGAVFRAHDRATGDAVALKVMQSLGEMAAYLPVAGSLTGRAVLYWLMASTTDWVKSVFSSSVATGSPLTNSTRSREWLVAVE